MALKCKDCGNTDKFSVSAKEFHSHIITSDKEFVSDVGCSDCESSDDYCCYKCDSYNVVDEN